MWLSNQPFLYLSNCCCGHCVCSDRYYIHFQTHPDFSKPIRIRITGEWKIQLNARWQTSVWKQVISDLCWCLCWCLVQVYGKQKAEYSQNTAAEESRRSLFWDSTRVFPWQVERDDVTNVTAASTDTLFVVMKLSVFVTEKMLGPESVSQ